MNDGTKVIQVPCGESQITDTDTEILNLCKKYKIGVDELKCLIGLPLNGELPPAEIIPETHLKEKHLPPKFEFDIINIADLIIVIVCGAALLMATYAKYSDVVYTIVGGFMGYLGGSGRGILRKTTNNSNTTTSTSSSQTTQHDNRQSCESPSHKD